MKWNWGAALLSTYWAKEHGMMGLAVIQGSVTTAWFISWMLRYTDLGPYTVVIRLLCTLAIPALAIWFGLIGNREAWRYRHFPGGVPEFIEVQRQWMIRSFIWLPICIAGIIGLCFFVSWSINRSLGPGDGSSYSAPASTAPSTPPAASTAPAVAPPSYSPPDVVVPPSKPVPPPTINPTVQPSPTPAQQSEQPEQAPPQSYGNGNTTAPAQSTPSDGGQQAPPSPQPNGSGPFAPVQGQAAPDNGGQTPSTDTAPQPPDNSGATPDPNQPSTGQPAPSDPSANPGQ